MITSNFEKLRFFIHNAVAHIEFNLFTLTKEEFKIFWLCLNADNLLGGVPEKVKQESTIVEENVTKQLYKDYSAFKHELWQNICKNRPDLDKLLLFKKTQKLLDRFLFIFFAEDSGLLPPNSISRMVERFEQLIELDAEKPLYEIFKQYFGYINKGRKGKTTQDDIFAYNGGLFQPDELLDSLIIDDKILKPHVETMTAYDFKSDVDVNILGHIFENSLNEIENVTAQLEGQELDKSKTKRKKDGVFYTPKYITKYIAENTVGKLCEEKKAELNITDERFTEAGKRSKKGIADLEAYRNRLLELTICDPACGSGAFLNQALEFLISEHRYIDELLAAYHKVPIVLSNIENHILEKNIYGVDINDESVEIAKLSLWLRTAQRGRKLTSLNNNIKCGNSLIDDPEVAGEKAFNWQKEFPQVFEKKDKKAWHIIFAIYNSRYSTDADGLTRRFAGDTANKPGFIARTYPELLPEQEIIIAEELAKAAEEYSLNITACNICKDHVHAIIVCEEDELSYLTGKWKGRSAFTYNQRVNPLAVSKKQKAQYADGTKEKFWAKSFKPVLIKDKEQYQATVNYIKNNRTKHKLPPQTDGFTRRLNQMICTHRHAFRPEHKGGFDVIIGNPPYVRSRELMQENEKTYLVNYYKTASYQLDLYKLFIEKSLNLINNKGKLSFITPSVFLSNDYDKPLRKFILENYNLVQISTSDKDIFTDASVKTVVFTIDKNIANQEIKFFKIVKGDFLQTKLISKNVFINQDYTINENINLSSLTILNKLQNCSKLDEFFVVKNGIKVRKDLLYSSQIDTNYKSFLLGKNINIFSI